MKRKSTERWYDISREFWIWLIWVAVFFYVIVRAKWMARGF